MIGAAAAGHLAERTPNGRHTLVRGRGAHHSPRLFSQAAPFLDHVEPDHPDSRGDEKADDQLPDQAKADDARRVAQLSLGPPDPVHRDGTHGGKCGVLR